MALKKRRWYHALPVIVITAMATLSGVLAVENLVFDARAREENAAWHKALDLAQATPKERAAWVRPVVEYPPLVQIRPDDPRPGCGDQPQTICARRICGETYVFYTLDPKKPDTVHPGSYTALFLIPEEAKYRPGLLTHEFLHSIWWNRANKDQAFGVLNPDSEAWVESLVAATCPKI